MPRIAVVIPFYQRSAGLLKRAIESIWAQRYQPEPLIVVVDDASPIPADDELANVPRHRRDSIIVVRQENAGPGAARNRGLDVLPGDIAFVAFLDSDDQWRPGHLRRAIDTLLAGGDFYFSNYLDIGAMKGAFEARSLVDPAQHLPVAGIPGAYAYQGDLLSAILTGCPIETSTVVFRRAPFRDLRFRVQFRHAYEDLMFWFDAVSRNPGVTFSSEIGCEYGLGLNIYRGITPGSDASLRALVGSACFRASVRSCHPLSPEQLERVRDRLREIRAAMAYEVLNRIRRKQPLLWSELLRLFRADPAAIVLLPWEMLRHAGRWLRSRRART